MKAKTLIDGKRFYDQPINDLVKQFDEIRKVSTGQDDYYTMIEYSKVNVRLK